MLESIVVAVLFCVVPGQGLAQNVSTAVLDQVLPRHERAARRSPVICLHCGASANGVEPAYDDLCPSCALYQTEMAALLAPQLIPPSTLTFSTVAQGTIGQITQSQELVVRTAEAWDTLWQTNGSEKPRPAVDFGQSLVVGVFLGTRPTAGYSVEIVSVRRRGERAVVVDYVEHRPPADALLAQVITSPFHLVSLSANVETVEFNRLDPPV